MTLSRLLTSAAAAFLALTGSLAAAAPAGAAECPSGNFCAWENADYQGQRSNWSGDDGWWESSIADDDSSWANHGLEGPGIPAFVQVFEDFGQRGDMTLCLAPGQEVDYNGAANDRGDSHQWAHSC
ncbi:peptidase inhibitor family I36 protein [Streptomyces sp. NPDC053755]|uniref:peptidase inhibitor family I36 protein n=1 Tax=Streptomyces sp. NPDC053755 TaxID=3155815 RepID=UPI0034389287